MPARWFIGDLHFGHEKVALIRGFDSTETHDVAIVKKWNRQVQEDDEVFVLGDISGGSARGEDYALTLLATLPGIKHLTAGNHDSVSSIHRDGYKKQERWRGVFASIRDFGRIRVEGRDVLLSHYPYLSQGEGPGRKPEIRYAQYRLTEQGLPLVHAHTHHTDPFDGSPSGLEMCVSWDAWRRLVNYGDIAQWIKGLS